MQRASRLRFFIIATIACAMLFCIAAFSVSFAKWDLGDDSTATKEANGKAANFYVEYPQYAASSSGVVVPNLVKDTYYLQVQKDGGMSDYYGMSTNPVNTAEKMINNVYLEKDTVVNTFNGKSVHGINKRKSDSSAEFVFSNGTAKVGATGYYNFYYEFGQNQMYAKYTPAPTSGNTGSGTTTTVAPERDLTKRSVKVNFNGGVSVIFEAINHDDDHDLNFHIWKSTGTGNETKWPGIKMNKDGDNDTNTFTYGFDAGEIKGIIINCVNGRTGGDTWFFDEKFPDGLKDNYTYTFDLTNLHNCVEGDKKFDGTYVNKRISVTEKAPQTVTTGNTGNTGDTIDTSLYTELFTVKFSDDAQPKKLYFKTGTGATGLYANLNNLAVHIRANDHSAYYYNSNVHDGSGSGDGDQRKVSYLNKGIVNVGTKSNTVISFGFEEQNYSNSATTSPVLFLADYAVGENNYISLHTAKGGSPKLKTAGGSGSEDEITPAEPDYEGSTVFDASQSADLNDKKDVRVTNAVVTEDGGYKYNNYICVSRKNSAATTKDNSTAYLEFEVSDCSINPYNVKVKSLTIKRRATDANGNIKDRFVDPAPRIYNYDAGIDTRLGPDTSDDDLSNPNKNNRKPLFACGKLHDTFESNVGNMIEHFDDGVYAVLYFGDGDQQYFALDIEIVTDQPVDFKLTARVANHNSWERYADGYGEPWGFYMGGKINSVETWDPSRTTKLERASDRYVTKFDPSYESEKINIETATDAQIEEFNALPEFNYNLIKFYKSTGGVEGYARYPKGKIDVSLTVNLTEGSLIKMYMIDHDGHRDSGHTVYIIPSELIYDDATKALFRDDTYKIYDNELNTIIPKTGTYIFRLVGYFHTRFEGVENSKGEILTGDQVCFEDGKRYETIPSGKTGMGLPNFNLWVDTLYITCANAGEGNSECEITLNANGGTFADEDLTEEGDTSTQISRKVTFGSDIRNLPKPTNGDKEIMSWYYTDDEGNEYDFDFGSPVTGNMTLYAKWEATWEITFDANGGTLPSGAKNPLTTDKYGYLTKEQLNANTPTRDGHKFLGWYTVSTQEGGKKISADTPFSANRTVYARWEQVTLYTITFNYNGMPGMTTVTQTVEENAKAKKPTATLPEHYNVDGWYTNASCTTAYDFNTAVTSTSVKTLYAKWYADAGVYFDGVWVHGLKENEENKDGTEYMALDVELDKADGAVVTVWCNKEKGKVKKDNNFAAQGATEANLGKGVYSFYYKYGSNTAADNGLWIACKYIVTFDLNYEGSADATKANTGEVTKSGTSLVGKLAQVDIPANPTRTGYSFGGWYTAATGGTKVTLSTTYNFTASTTLYAHWVKQYTVTLNANGGKWGNVDERSHDVDENKKIAESIANDEPTRANYKFAGWYTAASGGELFDLKTENITAKTDLWAHWTALYTVTFHLNDGTAGTFKTLTDVEDGSTIDEPADKPTRSGGWAFTKWYKDAACTDEWIFDGDEATTVSETTKDLYAGWEVAAVTTYTITFDVNTANKGSGTNTVSEMNTGDQIVKPAADPTSSDELYAFDGWYTAKTGGTKVTTFPKVGTSDVTYYAHYKAVRVKFTFQLGSTTNYGNNIENVRIHIWTTDNGNYTTPNWTDRSKLGGDSMSGNGRTFTYTLTIDSKGPANGIIITFRDVSWGSYPNRVAKSDDITGTFSAGNSYTFQFGGWGSGIDWNSWWDIPFTATKIN